MSHDTGSTNRPAVENLMRRFPPRDREAFEEFYRQMSPSVRHFASSQAPAAQVDDVVQEVFLRILQMRDRVAGNANAEAFLIGVTKNVVAEFARDSCGFAPLCENAPANDGELDAGLREEDLRRLMGLARSTLSEKQSQAFDLANAEGLPTDKAAEIAGCTEKAFRRRIEEYRRKLREFFASRSALSAAPLIRMLARLVPGRTNPRTPFGGPWRIIASGLMAAVMVSVITLHPNASQRGIPPARPTANTISISIAAEPPGMDTSPDSPTGVEAVQPVKKG